MAGTRNLAVARVRDRARAADRREVKRVYAAQWRARNPQYQAIRYHADANVRIRDNLRSSLQTTIAKLIHRQQPNWHSNSRIGRLLGCSPHELIVHIQSQFQPGMSWDNRGLVWQIDHIRGCASFDLTDPAQQALCFHYTNLRPLFEADNQRRYRKE